MVTAAVEEWAESLVSYRVSKGAARAESRRMPEDIARRHTGENLATALVYNGFAQEPDARIIAGLEKLPSQLVPGDVCIFEDGQRLTVHTVTPRRVTPRVTVTAVMWLEGVAENWAPGILSDRGGAVRVA